jgi:hypothetical protein
MNLDFGDYCRIEQHRFGHANEHYVHKVIGRLRSNTWVDVPVVYPIKEVRNDHIEDIVACVCCGVSERDIFKYRLSDVHKHENIIKCTYCECIDRTSFYRDKEDNDICRDCDKPIKHSGTTTIYNDTDEWFVGNLVALATAELALVRQGKNNNVDRKMLISWIIDHL